MQSSTDAIRCTDPGIEPPRRTKVWRGIAFIVAGLALLVAGEMAHREAGLDAKLARLERGGARIRYGWSPLALLLAQRFPWLQIHPSESVWIRNDSRARWLQEPIEISLERKESAPAWDLDDVFALQSLRHIELRGKDKLVSVKIAERLARMPNLRDLSVEETNLNDSALESLARRKDWKHLNLSSTEITDAGLLALADQACLEVLKLSSTRISDTGVGHLRHVQSLQQLHLAGTRITDESLKYLKSMRLFHLTLSDTDIRGPGLTELAGMPLSYLSLDGLPVDKNDVKPLMAPPLRQVSVERTRISRTQEKAMRTDLFRAVIQ